MIGTDSIQEPILFTNTDDQRCRARRPGAGVADLDRGGRGRAAGARCAGGRAEPDAHPSARCARARQRLRRTCYDSEVHRWQGAGCGLAGGRGRGGDEQHLPVVMEGVPGDEMPSWTVPVDAGSHGEPLATRREYECSKCRAPVVRRGEGVSCAARYPSCCRLSSRAVSRTQAVLAMPPAPRQHQRGASPRSANSAQRGCSGRWR